MTPLDNPSGCMHLRKRRDPRRNLFGDALLIIAGLYLWIFGA